MKRNFPNSIVLAMYCILQVVYFPTAAAADVYQSILTFGTFGQGDEDLQNPYGLDVDDVSGNIYVADTGNSKIKIFSRFGEYLNSFGNEGSDDGEFLYPQGVALDPNGDAIYVTDTASHRIQKFQKDGNNYPFILKFGSEGSENGQFYLPRDIEVDSSGTVYVCDSGNNRISKFDSLGNWLMNFGESDALLSPYGLDLDDSIMSDQINLLKISEINVKQGGV